ncbi:MAG: hypothetical protein WC592_08550 [Candidatus Omnitrophota bacterium]|nr:hypothetical protein [Candidatus Omnitrophota bacterium]
MTVMHKELAAGRWAKMPLCEQMANVGSEVDRALNWRSKGNADHSRNAFERALELMDLTIESASSFARLKELTRVREAMVDYFMGQNIFGSTDELWRSYFMYFAYVARKGR